MSAEFSNYRGMYPSAPAQVADIFEQKLVDIDDALLLSKSIKELLVTEETPIKEEKKEKWYGHAAYSPYVPYIYAPCINNNCSGGHNHTSTKETSDSERTILGGIAMAVWIPTVTYFLSKDYKRYLLYRKADTVFKGLKESLAGKKFSRPVGLLELCNNASQREIDFCVVYQGWKGHRSDIKSDIVGDALNKLGGGIGALIFTLSIIFGSPIGAVGGSLFAGCALANHFVKDNTRDATMSEIDDLGRKAKRFCEKYRVTIADL